MHPLSSIAVGYRALIDRFQLSVVPYYKESYVLPKGTPYREVLDGREIHYYAKSYLPKDPSNPFLHLEFALKHEGVNLELLSRLFDAIDRASLVEYIISEPTGRWSRRVWFLFEFLKGEELPLPDTKHGPYVPLLDAEQYYTSKPRRSRRHRIWDNLLGGREFCPLVRRTERMERFEAKDLARVANQMVAAYDPALIARATNYLYFKETMSSFEIEMEKPGMGRANRFVELLKEADHLGPLNRELLLQLQHSIVDQRFADRDYRDFQNFIGAMPRLDVYEGMTVHYIAPKPENVEELMRGLLFSLERMFEGEVHPVVIAACIAFGFVFIHPFSDGNGRLHRFLIHYIFARADFVPKGAIFPISAVILKSVREYDRILESFSEPLLRLISNYAFDAEGRIQVEGNTSLLYRYIDFTAFAEYLFACVETTISTDFKEELQYLANYDKVKRLLQATVDMPDRLLDLFIRSVTELGKLSTNKRKAHFAMLTESEIATMESIVVEHMRATHL